MARFVGGCVRPLRADPAEQMSMLDEAGRTSADDIERRGRELLASLEIRRRDLPDGLRATLHERVVLARTRDDPSAMERSAFALGLYHFSRGAWRDAERVFRETAGRAGFPRDAACAIFHEAQAARMRSSAERTLRICVRALRASHAAGAILLASRIRILAARVYAEIGELAPLRRSLARAARLQETPEGWVWDALRGEWLRRSGRAEEADELFARFVPGVTASSVVLPDLRSLLHAAWIHWGLSALALQRPADARRIAAEALLRVDRSDAAEQGRTLALAARIAFREGDEEEADRLWSRAAARFRRARNHAGRAEVFLQRGEAAVLMHDTGSRALAREDLMTARAIFARLGRPHDRHRCDLALESLRDRRSRIEPNGAGRPRRLPRVPRIRRLSQLGFLTSDPELLAALEPLESLARTSIPVLILGESGTGKEVLARALHRAGGGRGPWVAVNCGALPDDLQESELFGHVRGAFTGAVADKTGLFEAAHGGTLFLDEVGEMSAAAQVKLLRALELGEVRRVGETRIRQIQARVLAATNADLEEGSAARHFRRDLYYRLRGLMVRLPPLRERLGDVPLLSAHFLRLFSQPQDRPLSLSSDALDLLLQHRWPGNVRELRFVIEKAVAVTRAVGREAVEVDCLDLDPAAPAVPPEEPPPSHPIALEVPRDGLEATIENMERRLILRALEESGWNRTRAAQALGGMSRTTLIGKMKRLGLFPGPIPIDGAGTSDSLP